MEKRELFKGDVLQLKPDYPNGFGGMLIICEEPKSWGCQGYLMSAHDFQAVKFKGRAFLRPKFENMEYVGSLVWLFEDSEEINN
jgi:hypothetical protein